VALIFRHVPPPLLHCSQCKLRMRLPHRCGAWPHKKKLPTAGCTSSSHRGRPASPFRANHLTQRCRISPDEVSLPMFFSEAFKLKTVWQPMGAVGSTHWYKSAAMAGSLHSITAIAKQTHRAAAAAAGSDPLARKKDRSPSTQEKCIERNPRTEPVISTEIGGGKKATPDRLGEIGHRAKVTRF